MMGSLVVLLSSQDQWLDAISKMPTYVTRLHPLALAMVFVFTKVLHELSHAIVCRRAGARCGEVGVIIMCGVPCPYCDVTDVWRVPSVLSRCGVMLAGIYIELVIASLSVVGWMVSRDPTWQLFFAYVMLVCGVSTLLFNANPLMRYDGYHVLSDLLGSTNLRSESRDAITRFVDRALGGPGAGRTLRQSRRTYALAIYSFVASIYRGFIVVAISLLLVHLLSYVHLQTTAMVFVVTGILVSLAKSIIKLFDVARGTGRWSAFPRWRRTAGVFLTLLAIIGFVFVPLPRYRRLTGRIEPADAVAVYVNQAGTIDRVEAEIGTLVTAGQRLVTIDNPDVVLESVKLQGQLRLATLRRQSAERSALDHPEAARHWEVLRASESATRDRVDAMRERELQQHILAPVSGIVLHAEDSERMSVAMTSGKSARHEHVAAVRLAMLQGMGASAAGAWCRISPDRARQLVLLMDAKDYQSIRIGSRVVVNESQGTSGVYETRIGSCSTIARDVNSVTNEAYYEVTCPLRRVEDAEFVATTGAQVDAVIRMDSRSLAEEMMDWLMVWLRD